MDSPDDTTEATHRVEHLCLSLEDAVRGAASGQDLEQEPMFVELVALLAGGFDAAQRLDWITSASVPLSCAAFAAMAQVGDATQLQAARVLNRVGYYGWHFALRFMDQSDAPEVFGRVLLRLPVWLGDYPSTRTAFFIYLARLWTAGVVPVVSEGDADLDWALEDRRNAFAEFDQSTLRTFLEQLERLDRRRLAAARTAQFAYTQALCKRLDEVHALLSGPTRPSLLLVGDAGVGKASLLRATLRAMASDGWTVVEASPCELLEELRHVHPVEEQVESLVAGLSGDRHVWHATNWFELLDLAAGDYPSLLERLWPHLQCGLLQVVGSAGWLALSRVEDDLPHFSSVVRTMDIHPPHEQEMRSLLRDWVLRQSNLLGRPVIDDLTLLAAPKLIHQCYPHGSEPGRTLAVLGEALDRALAQPDDTLPLRREQILETLRRRSGLSPRQLAGLLAGQS
jgi:hypothetical protein